MHGLRDGDRGLRETGGDELELAVERRDVAARPDAVEAGLHHAVDDDRALLELEAPLLERAELGGEAELEQHRVALELLDQPFLARVVELDALDRAVAGDA